MLKLTFILLGIFLLLFAVFKALFKVKSDDRKDVDETINLSKCSYCSEFVNESPKWENNVCQTCQRVRLPKK
tara:strand:+ start:270463 stop:270678 length:216 start_codon:yes stop_codon:yes gene_type:complete